MISDLKKFWSKYIPYKLHPDDEDYLNNDKDKYCLEIPINEFRNQYGEDLKSDSTLENFKKEKGNQNKIFINLLPIPFLGDVVNAKVYILMGNPGFHSSAYIDEVENEDYVKLIKKNLLLSSDSFICLKDEAKETGGYKYWSQKGRIPKISQALDNINNKSSAENYKFVRDSVCIVESIAYHSCAKPNNELYKLPSSKLTKRLVNEYIQNRVYEKKAMCFVWRSASFWKMKEHLNILIRNPKEARLSNFTNDEVEKIARFLYA